MLALCSRMGKFLAELLGIWRRYAGAGVKDLFDRIAASTPLNRTAGAVTARGGDHYSPSIVVQKRRHSAVSTHSDAPAKMLRKLPVDPNFEDFTGKKIGKLTVLGYLGKLNPNYPGRWQVRCVCGAYEQRTAKAIKRALAGVEGFESGAQCVACQKWEVTKKRYARCGSAPLSDFVGGVDRRKQNGGAQ